MMEKFNEKVKFIKKHEAEIKPLLEDAEFFDKMERGEKPNKEEVRNILEQYETHIYVFDKDEKECAKNAKRIIMEISETLAFLSSYPLIEALKKDKRCKAICLLTDNLGGQRFEKEEANKGFRKLRNENKTVLEEIPGSFDVALTCLEPPNSPNSVLLSGAKSVFGAKKLYLFSNNFFGIAGQELMSKNFRENIDKINEILCINEMVKRIIEKQLPEFSEKKIRITGSPLIDAVINDNKKKKEYAENAQKKLGINDKDKVVLYLEGGLSEKKGDRMMDKKSCIQTTKIMIELAKQNSDKSFVFLLRPHPTDPEKEEFLNNALKLEKPANLKILPATKESLSIQEAIYVAEDIVSVNSTESFLAPLRKKRGVFLNFYKEEGENEESMENFFPKETREIIKKTPNMAFLQSDKELFDYLNKNLHEVKTGLPLETSRSQITSAEKIRDILLL